VIRLVLPILLLAGGATARGAISAVPSATVIVGSIAAGAQVSLAPNGPATSVTLMTGSNVIGQVQMAQGPAGSATVLQGTNPWTVNYASSGPATSATVFQGTTPWSVSQIANGPAVSATILGTVATTVAANGPASSVTLMTGSNVIGQVQMAQGPAGSASLITTPANLLTVSPFPSSTWTVVGTVSVNTHPVTMGQGPAVSASIIIPAGTTLPTVTTVTSLSQLSGTNATPFLRSGAEAVGSTPFRTTAAGAAIKVLAPTTIRVVVNMIGGATDFCQCGITTGAAGANAAQMNTFVNIYSPYDSGELRLPITGATLYCGSGQGTHGLVAASVTWFRRGDGSTP